MAGFIQFQSCSSTAKRPPLHVLLLLISRRPLSPLSLAVSQISISLYPAPIRCLSHSLLLFSCGPQRAELNLNDTLGEKNLCPI